MAEPRRITLQEAGAPIFTLQPYQARHPNLVADFELKTVLINLLPKFHSLPAQEPIKKFPDSLLKTIRHHSANETTILLPAFPFSLEGKAREWFYTQPEAVVTNWDLLIRKFLDKYFPAEVANRLRKEIFCIIQGETESLYEYWERFRNLLDSCPHQKIDQLVLICYFTKGMKPQGKTTLDAASNGFLKKYKMATKVWQLITDLAESTQNARHRNNHPKAIAEVSSSIETAALTQTLGEITSILKQLQLNQQQPQPPPQQQCQQLVSHRMCGICACYTHYTDECPQLQQEDNILEDTHNFYDCPNQGYYQQSSNYNQGGNYTQGWQDNSNPGWRDNLNQGWRGNSNQGWRDNYNQGGRDNGGNQRWNNTSNQQNRYQ
ncbi:uncharacterized protein LOC130981385 [Arachis stenosperma]|uniref:uncharacterized protein LOC130981385 n=1 Tax=Arachis stenosperma TaxID=217475 RepID=UPI0025ACCAB6|nr:uncharacterized protein LOC130981385 [Arachis stenosperma]